MRRIKVEELSHPWEVNERGDSVKSIIRLKGKWLVEAGFKPDDHVRVTIEHDRLIITKEE